MKPLLLIALLLSGTALRADEEFRELKGHTGPTRVAIVTADGKKVVSCSGWPEGDGTVRVWDFKTGKLLHTMKGHTGNIDYMTLSADGKLAFTAGSDHTARVWDVETGKEKLVFKGHGEASVTSIAVSNDGKLVASGDNKGKILFWNPADGKSLREMKIHNNEVRCLAFALDGKVLVSGSWDGKVKLSDPATAKETRELEHETKKVENICVFDDGKKLLVACDEVTMWDLTKGEEIRSFEGISSPICLAVSPDGKKMVTGGYDGIMRLWNAETGEHLADFQAHESYCHWLSFSPDGKSILSSGGGRFENGTGVKGSDHVVRIWKLQELAAKEPERN